jgi:hypothetical protein
MVALVVRAGRLPRTEDEPLGRTNATETTILAPTLHIKHTNQAKYGAIEENGEKWVHEVECAN